MNTRRAFQLILLLAGLVFTTLGIYSVVGSQAGQPGGLLLHESLQSRQSRHYH